MDDIADLVQRFADNRHSLTSEELALVLRAAEESPELAEALHEQQLLSAIYAERDAYEFAAGELEGESPVSIASPEAELVVDMRQLASSELQRQQELQQQASVRQWQVAACGLLLLLLAGGAIGWWTLHSHWLAIVVQVTGRPQVTSGESVAVVLPEARLRGGEQISTLPGDSATFRFVDGSAVRLLGDSSLTLSRGSRGGEKNLELSWGSLAADVVGKQHARPVIIKTPLAECRATDARLWIQADSQRTRVDVSEGVAELYRLPNGDRIVINPGEYAVASTTEIVVHGITWPTKRTGLVALIDTLDAPCLYRESPHEALRSFTPLGRGAARLNHDFAMVAGDGAFHLWEVEPALLAACRETNALSIEAVIKPDSLDRTVNGRILTFSSDSHRCNFSLGQERDRLILRLNTGPTPADERLDEFALCTLTSARPQHVLVTYRPGLLTCYLDGRQIFSSTATRGELGSWLPQRLLVGDEDRGGRPWYGTLEGVAIYNRAIERDEAQRNASEALRRVNTREPVPQIKAEATLVARSQLPLRAELSSQRNVLVMSKYRIDRVTAGELPAGEVLVAEWAAIEGDVLPACERPLGTKRHLSLERFGLNPQLAAHPCFDDFDTGASDQAARYFDVSSPLTK